MLAVTVTKAVTFCKGLNRMTSKNDKICFLLKFCKPLNRIKVKIVDYTRSKPFQKHIAKLSKEKKVLINDLESGHSKVQRIPIELYSYFKNVGKGNFHRGILRASFICSCNEKASNEAEKELIMNDVNKLMQHLKLLFPEVHHNDLHNLPAFVRMTLNGKCNINILKIEGDKSGRK